MIAEDAVGLLIPLTWLTMLAVEALWPGRRWPALRGWRSRGFAFFAMVMTLNALLPGLLPPGLRALHLFDARGLGLTLSVVVGYLLLSLVTALMHRAYHRYDLLWRWIHQLHHAPRRLDVSGAVVFTPWEVVLNIAAFQFVVVFVLGLEPVAAALLGYLAFFYGVFQHLNVRTPRWLGFLIQRPESHGVHHRRGLHDYNYADLPLWDLLWGTFRNPRDFQGEVGFDEGAEPGLAPLFVGRDANAGLYGRANRGRPVSTENPA